MVWWMTGAVLAAPLAGRDIASMSGLRDPQLAPDGRQIAYVVSEATFDEEADPGSDDTGGWVRSQQIWLTDIEGAEPRQLTRGDARAGHPRWSPDGATLGFSRGGEIWLLPLVGGEARLLSTGELEPSDWSWAPDGLSIAFVAPEPDEERDDADWTSGGAVDWAEQWAADRLWVVDLAGGEPRAASPDWMHVADYAWSPDGRWVAAVVSQNSDPYAVFSEAQPVVIDVESGELHRTMADEPTALGHLGWSPDSRWVAWESGDGTLSLLNALRAMDVETGEVLHLSQGMDATHDGFTWTSPNTVVAHIVDRTRSSLVELRLRRGARRVIPIDMQLHGPLQPHGATGIVRASTPQQPWSIMRVDLRRGGLTPIVRSNAQVEDWPEVQTSVVTWNTPEGPAIEGIFHVPAGDGVPPLLVLPHGGPDGVSVESFQPWVRFFTSRGYAVLQPNYRGGLGYGIEHYAANRGRLGEIEFADIESGVDSLIAAGRVDADRLLYGGWSWGGYLSAWTVAHTDRYRAAVAGAPVTDPTNQYALSDINHGVVGDWEYGGNPWKNEELFDRASPVRHMDNATIPTLVIHGRRDDRVPFGQGLTLYRALDDVGCEARLLAYPGERHGFRQPAHVAHMLDAWASWYAEHLAED